MNTKHVLSLSIILWMTYLSHEYMQKIHYGYCRSNLLTILFHGNGHYCTILDTTINLIESKFTSLMSINPIFLLT